ncbi:uncharacterized protein N7498_003373 [Penicillium cinerascens]|uniref:Uncharacterized protein n=1 Tax=Penicillium cinerascens TaxID=70096 RepID=A0A9W9T6U5_9EURO|nr:uncharacterized protein N7498_003373 [Penicillium cinerascens]KAJ5211727.1 hypothetical protein N7498_003373 [Penicillium cinerascens]
MASVMRNSTLKRLLFSLAVTLLVASLALSTKLPLRVIDHGHGHDHLHHHKRSTEHKHDVLNHNLQERRTTTYAAAVRKGRGLMCLMESTIAKAATLNLAGNIQSTWLASDDLISQGWRPMNMGTFTYKDLTIDLPVYGSKLDAFFSSMGISFNSYSAQYAMSIAPGRYSKDGNLAYCIASQGIFGNMIDTSSGTIVADLNRSPLSMNYQAVTLSNFCPIRQWSDAVYTQWLAAEAEESTSLNRIVRAGITNTATQEFVIQALQNKGTVTEIPTWDANNQLTLTRADDGDFFAAILGSPNGAGCAYLLAQHKAQLGIKQLTSVSVWMSGNTPFALTAPIGTLGQNLNLLFMVETVAEPIDVV